MSWNRVSVRLTRPAALQLLRLQIGQPVFVAMPYSEVLTAPVCCPRTLLVLYPYVR
jgi:hypothetical protein